MTKEDIILACMATSDGASFRPVQIQKSMFLIDQEASAQIGGPLFDFKPYDYGPFDVSVYNNLTILSEKGLVQIEGDPASKQRRYSLTAKGQQVGEATLGTLVPNIQDYLKRVSEFVLRLTFAQLVSSIYKKYPAMKANSVFSAQ